jgi:hypothetical protein
VSSAVLVLAPVLAGRADAARAAIDRLREPFARVPGTHMARVQVLKPPARRFRGRTGHYVLLAADHDGPPEPWLAAAGRELEPVLAHCAFWPGAGDAAAVVRWARARELRVGFSVVGSPQASVDDVLEALQLREHVLDVAARAADLDDAALQAAWAAGP